MRLVGLSFVAFVIAAPVPSVSGEADGRDLLSQRQSIGSGQVGGFASTYNRPITRPRAGSTGRAYQKYAQPRSRATGTDLGNRPKPKQKPIFPHRRPFFGTFCCDYTPREETIVIVQPPEPPPEPPAVVETEPPPPPDPRGPRFKRARGPVRAQVDFEVGDRVPRRQPIVALDWRQFELPEPEIGTGYYRIGREVLVLDLYTREILQVATPG